MGWRWSPSGTITNEARFGFNLAPAYFLTTQKFGRLLSGSTRRWPSRTPTPTFSHRAVTREPGRHWTTRASPREITPSSLADRSSRITIFYDEFRRHLARVCPRVQLTKHCGVSGESICRLPEPAYQRGHPITPMHPIRDQTSPGILSSVTQILQFDEPDFGLSDGAAESELPAEPVCDLCRGHLENQPATDPELWVALGLLRTGGREGWIGAVAGGSPGLEYQSSVGRECDR